MVTGEVRLLQLQNIDGRDEIEDFWLRNRELVFQSAKISSEHQIDSESSKNVIAAGHQTKHEEIQIGTCCICIMSTGGDSNRRRLGRSRRGDDQKETDLKSFVKLLPASRNCSSVLSRIVQNF